MEPTSLDRHWALDTDGKAVLRPIQSSDLETLRQHKNRMRSSFFFQDEITPEMQQSWYDGFREREDDWMFVIDVAGEPSGCIGLRLEEDVVDFYNLMMWANSGNGLMSRSLTVLIEAAHEAYPAAEIEVVVLTANPTVDWYVHRGFRRHGFGEWQGLDYLTLRYGGFTSIRSTDD